MREIIFKAKRTNNGEWVEGFYANCYFPTSDVRTGYFIIEYPGEYSGEYHEIYTETICQYTGLTDKKGKKIWENDIVETSDGTRGVVKFGKYGDMKTDYGFYIEWDKTQPYWRNDICYWQSDIMVITSIFDNPELLEGGTK